MDKHDDETVERVARAICAAFPMGWDGILEAQRDHLRDLARAALSAIPAPADDGWMPIETAPKEPLRWLQNGWVDGQCGPVVLLGHWSKRLKRGWLSTAGCWVPEHKCWRFLHDDGAGDAEPTHWQPLPPAPAQEPRS